MDVVREIHPRDHMWHSGADWYFDVGQDALKVIQWALAMSWLQRIPARILDLPCGHGRVARFLRAGFPGAELFFCDINEEGAEFCAKTFGGTAIISELELTDVELPRQLDVIWVGSLFTHICRRRTERWLPYLAGYLEDHGILVATFHGAWTVESQKVYPHIHQAVFDKIVSEYESSGYGYAPYPDTRDYGFSIAKPEIIMKIASGIGGVRVLAYTERGWANNQDVLVITRNDRLKPWP
jgi:SAM-dependent methyltransferase